LGRVFDHEALKLEIMHAGHMAKATAASSILEPGAVLIMGRRQVFLARSTA
jgi:hypothetical protein